MQKPSIEHDDFTDHLRALLKMFPSSCPRQFPGLKPQIWDLDTPLFGSRGHVTLRAWGVGRGLEGGCPTQKQGISFRQDSSNNKT